MLNLRKILTATVEQEGAAKPFLLSIGERAAELAEAYEDRQVTTQQVLVEFERLAQEYVEADAQRRQLGLDANAFAIHRELRRAAGGSTPEQAREVDALFSRFPDFVWNEQQKSKLRAELYKTLRPLVGPAKMIEAANALLRVQRL